MKHGHGKATYAGLQGRGQETYDGDWQNDKMHGYGTYFFTSSAVYTGQWSQGKMHGKGKIVNADGTSYVGDWAQNVMSGEGCYIDIDQVKWEGIFINGSYESKIQKKLRVEKEIDDKVCEYQLKAKVFFVTFQEAFARSNKQSYKENVGALFASPDTCIDFVAEPYTKFEERAPEKWSELIRTAYNEGNVSLRVLKIKEDSSVIKQESILVDQLRVKKGGQIVEFETAFAEKTLHVALCQLPTDQWVLVHCSEK